jgi:hypothetical protein
MGRTLWRRLTVGGVRANSLGFGLSTGGGNDTTGAAFITVEDDADSGSPNPKSSSPSFSPLLSVFVVGGTTLAAAVVEEAGGGSAATFATWTGTVLLADWGGPNPKSSSSSLLSWDCNDVVGSIVAVGRLVTCWGDVISVGDNKIAPVAAAFGDVMFTVVAAGDVVMLGFVDADVDADTGASKPKSSSSSLLSLLLVLLSTAVGGNIVMFVDGDDAATATDSFALVTVLTPAFDVGTDACEEEEEDGGRDVADDFFVDEKLPAHSSSSSLPLPLASISASISSIVGTCFVVDADEIVDGAAFATEVTTDGSTTGATTGAAATGAGAEVADRDGDEKLPNPSSSSSSLSLLSFLSLAVVVVVVATAAFPTIDGDVGGVTWAGTLRTGDDTSAATSTAVTLGREATGATGVNDCWGDDNGGNTGGGRERAADAFSSPVTPTRDANGSSSNATPRRGWDGDDIDVDDNDSGNVGNDNDDDIGLISSATAGAAAVVVVVVSLVDEEDGSAVGDMVVECSEASLLSLTASILTVSVLPVDVANTAVALVDDVNGLAWDAPKPTMAHIILVMNIATNTKRIPYVAARDAAAVAAAAKGDGAGELDGDDVWPNGSSPRSGKGGNSVVVGGLDWGGNGGVISPVILLLLPPMTPACDMVGADADVGGDDTIICVIPAGGDDAVNAAGSGVTLIVADTGAPNPKSSSSPSSSGDATTVDDAAVVAPLPVPLVLWLTTVDGVGVAIDVGVDDGGDDGGFEGVATVAADADCIARIVFTSSSSSPSPSCSSLSLSSNDKVFFVVVEVPSPPTDDLPTTLGLVTDVGGDEMTAVDEVNTASPKSSSKLGVLPFDCCCCPCWWVVTVGVALTLAVTGIVALPLEGGRGGITDVNVGVGVAEEVKPPKPPQSSSSLLSPIFTKSQWQWQWQWGQVNNDQ